MLFLIEMNRPIFLVLKGETMVLNYGDRVRSPFNTKKIGELISMRSKHEKSELQSKLKIPNTFKLAASRSEAYSMQVASPPGSCFLSAA